VTTPERQEEVMNRITRLITATTLAVALAGIAVPAAAQCPYGRVQRREARQCLRVERGLRCEQLGPREARRLVLRQRHIRRMELRAGADGRFAPRERLRIHRAMGRQDARIYRLRHNDRTI
jgi:hypothetical protein